jgi:DNA polymerase-1
VENWGPASALGYQLVIDGPIPGIGTLIADVETDECDIANFVGIAIIELGGLTVRYFSTLSSELKEVLNRSRFIGHNVKADLHWLNQWGCKVSAADIAGDTMIAEYCRDTTGGSYGLKDLAKKHLGWEWTKYKDLVGKGKKKVTLDKQPVEVVARYCGTDCAATAELSKRRLDPVARRIYEQLEMPVYRALFAMESLGATLDVPYLQQLNGEFGQRRDEALSSVRDLVGKGDFNPASPVQVKKDLFTKLGIRADKTDVATLKAHVDKPAIKALLDYREFSKLASTYTGPLLSGPTPGKVFARFNQVSYDSGSEGSRGIRTGRLSSSDPNLQNIPARTETGKKVREAFIASPGNTLVVADYSQIELRVLAHYSGEKAFLDAFHAGRDVHAETAAMMFGGASFWTEEEQAKNRKIAKTINFGLLYGCGPKKLAYLTGETEERAKELLDSYWKNLPGIQRWISSVKAQAYVRNGTKTLMGRFIPLAGLKSSDMMERWGAERQAVNYTIQGSAAEIMKLALIRLHERGLKLIATVHDEFIVDTPIESAELTLASVKGIMENVVRLKVPLLVEAHTGKNWAEAK